VRGRHPGLGGGRARGLVRVARFLLSNSGTGYGAVRIVQYAARQSYSWLRNFLSREEISIQDTTKRVRVNRQIRISPVRVIGADGSQLGILEVDVALRMAEEQGLDLVEVAATARPPVVRIMDYGKYKFEMAKQARVAKKKQHVIELKEVKYRPGIDDHDFDTKTRHARRFLEEKNKVKVTMMFRGRQVAHPELGQAVLERVATALVDVGKIESAGRLEGKSMTMILAPK
jgi:translation initiation factor IF-3